MEEVKIFNLSELVSPPNTDSISGRSAGEYYSKEIKLLESFENYKKIVFVIDTTLVKAINDSFIKGLFSSLFEKYKKISVIEPKIEIQGSEYYKRLFHKNWIILQAVENV